MNNIVITPKFRKMLRKRLSYYDAYNHGYTLNIMSEIYNVIAIIQKYPYIAPALTNDKNTRKAIIKKRFSIIYKVENKQVELLYFLDNRMLNDNYLAEEIVVVYQV